MRLALLALVLAACGGGPQLSALRCRSGTQACQDKEDPLKVLLSVDFTDGSGTFSAGALQLRVDGATQQTVALKDIFTAQGLDLAATKGTLQLDDDFRLDRMNQGQQISISLIATNGEGKDSNEPSISFTLHLGGP